MNAQTRRLVLVFAAVTAVLGLFGAILALALTSFSSGEGSVSARDLILQTSDLPPEFELVEENAFDRAELAAELAAASQVAEAGLLETAQVRYQEPGDDPVIVDSAVYVYENETAAAAAHAFYREPDPDELRPLDMGNGLTGYAFLDSQVVQGIGQDAFLMTGFVDYEDAPVDPARAPRTVWIYFMQRGNARAEVLVVSESIFLAPETAARNQYLRLARPGSIVQP